MYTSPSRVSTPSSPPGSVPLPLHGHPQALAESQSLPGTRLHISPGRCLCQGTGFLVRRGPVGTWRSGVVCRKDLPRTLEAAHGLLESDGEVILIRKSACRATWAIGAAHWVARPVRASPRPPPPVNYQPPRCGQPGAGGRPRGNGSSDRFCMTIDSREGARLGGRTAPGSARLTMVMRHFPPREATTRPWREGRAVARTSPGAGERRAEQSQAWPDGSVAIGDRSRSARPHFSCANISLSQQDN